MAAVRKTAPVIAVAALFFLAWKAVVVIGAYPPFILPAPEVVGERLVRSLVEGTIAPHAAATLSEIALGFTVGAVAALLTGYVLARSALAERLLSP
ncbi:MAG TPA: hypothetical protein VK992_05265, partial [Candidatus Caenarcaniphilales bacterium]|nr:hypothetical protein [Candidatus Caenarcaniphilales bacterium]